MIEIMTSWGFTTVVEALGLRNAHCTYIYTPSNDSYWSDPFAVWEFTESEFNILNDDVVKSLLEVCCFFKLVGK